MAENITRRFFKQLSGEQKEESAGEREHGVRIQNIKQIGSGDLCVHFIFSLPLPNRRSRL